MNARRRIDLATRATQFVFTHAETARSFLNNARGDSNANYYESRRTDRALVKRYGAMGDKVVLHSPAAARASLEAAKREIDAALEILNEVQACPSWWPTPADQEEEYGRPLHGGFSAVVDP